MQGGDVRGAEAGAGSWYPSLHSWLELSLGIRALRTGPSPVLARALARPLSTARAASLRIERVRLPEQTTGCAVGPVHFVHLVVRSQQVAGRARTEGAGALHTGPAHCPQLAARTSSRRYPAAVTGKDLVPST